MILICDSTGKLHRLLRDGRFTQNQRESLIKIAKEDPDATAKGVDQKIRPVIIYKPSGRARKTMYALMRNGDPVKPLMPMHEDW